MTTSLLTQGAASARRHPVEGPPPDTRLKAFPTAEGFGAESFGGRGPGGTTPQIIRVTNLNDTGAGSLRVALQTVGPRFIVFDVAGVIECGSVINVNQPYATIAGQTAPRGGICIRNKPPNESATLNLTAAHIIFRHVRIRQGFVGDQFPNPTAGSAGAGSKCVVQQGASNNTIWDHCSFSWSTDELYTTGGETQKLTLQYCIFSESLDHAGHEQNNHARPLNFSSEDTKTGTHRDITVHHCLVSHGQFRMPQISTWIGHVECINNVTYHTTANAPILMNPRPNFGQLLEPNAQRNRFVKNYFKRVQTASTTREITWGGPPTDRGPGNKIYVFGNLGPSRPTDTEAHWLSVSADDRSPAMGGTAPDDPVTVTDDLCTTTVGVHAGTFPHPNIRVTEQAAQAAYNTIITTIPVLGATRPLWDFVDQRIVQRVIDNTVPITGGPRQGLIDHPGQLAVPEDYSFYGGWPDYTIGGSPALWTEPAAPMVTASNGYLNIENALNALAGDAIP